MGMAGTQTVASLASDLSDRKPAINSPLLCSSAEIALGVTAPADESSGPCGWRGEMYSFSVFHGPRTKHTAHFPRG